MITASELEHVVCLMLQKLADTVLLVPKIEHFFPGTSGVSYNLCVKTGWKSSCIYGVKWGSEWRKERLHRHYICDVCTELPYVKGTSFSWVEWNLDYLMWLLALHHFHQPENPAWGASDAWNAAGTHVYDVSEGLEWGWNDKVGLALAYWESWREILPSLGGLFPPEWWLLCITVFLWDGRSAGSLLAREGWCCCPACFGCAFPCSLLHEVWYLSNPLVVWFIYGKSDPARRVRNTQLWLGANWVRPLAEAVYEGLTVLGSLMPVVWAFSSRIFHGKT